MKIHDLIRGREAGLAYAVAVLVTVLCWGVVLLGGDTVKSMDEPDFLAIAGNLAESGTFAREPGVPSAYRAPGLVFLLTPVAALGGGLMEARLTGGVLVGLGLVLLFQILHRHAGALAGLLGVVMVSGWPVVIYTASTLYPQTLGAFLLILTIWCLDRRRDGAGPWPVVVGGLAYGALVLTIPVALLLAPIFAAWVFAISRRGRVVAVLIFALVSGSLVGSWTLRNWITFDRFIPVATSSGFNLLAGNAPNTRWNTNLNIRFPEYVYTELTGADEFERNDIMTRAAVAEIRSDPGRYAQLYLAKFAHWFHFSNRLMSDDVIESGASAVPVGTREIILLAAWLVLIIGPLIARLALWRRLPPKKIEILFLALWVGAGLAYAVFFTRIRFRLPFDWLIISLNAIFIAALIEDYLARWRRG